MVHRREETDVKQIEINPQEIMMIAEGALRDGWVQGALKKSHGAIDDDLSLIHI